MTRILFVCHGNICRSPMAEFMFRRYTEDHGKAGAYYTESAATSYEEIGNPVHYNTRRILNSLGIDCSGKRARRITKKDYDSFDYIIGMDDANVRNMLYFYGSDPEHKIRKLLDFSNNPRNIADPRYTGNFDETYDDISEGIRYLFRHLEK